MESVVDRLVGAALNPDFLRAMAKPAATQVMVAFAVVALLGGLGYQRVLQSKAEFLSVVGAFPDVGWGLKGKSREDLETLKRTVETRLELTSQAMDQRLLVTEKLDALAKQLPDGIWLDGLSYQDHFEPTGAHQVAMTLQGSCFLIEPGDEVDVISQLASQLKQTPSFFQGFVMSQLGEIATRDAGNQTSYRTFTLTYNSQKRS